MRDFKHTHLSQRTMSSKKCSTSTKKHSFSSEHSHKKIPLLFERTNRSVIPNLCKKSTKQILMKFLNRKRNNVDISTLIRSFNKVRSFSPPTKKTHAPKLRLFSEPKKKLFTRRERQDQQNMNEPAADFEESSLHVFEEMRHRNKQFDDLIPKVKMAKLRFFHCDSRAALCHTLRKLRSGKRPDLFDQ
ncbi:unnamed protein product [Moneuplotes crassus]|uniref:Uncharacterized protein n=1 Tax=Euplotes crassus TaxID=5936 RepID=A0AAD1UTP6_EUPCR|nr:unnamed protein product [Moneuplotes crassus]